MTNAAMQLHEDQSPAEMILGCKEGDILRISYSVIAPNQAKQSVELFVWICPRSGFFKGINVIDQCSIKAISERPLNSQQLLLFINNTSFQPGVDIIELTDKAALTDLERLYTLMQNVT